MRSATLKSLTFMKKDEQLLPYLSNNKGVLNLHEPPLAKTCTNIMQFLKQQLELSYPNHTQAVVRGVKLTTKQQAEKLDRSAK